VSGADGSTVAAGPRLFQAIRSSAVDFYSHFWRLIPANLVWGAVLGAVVVVGLASVLAGAVLALLLAIPTAGIYRLGTLIARGEDVALADGFRAYRRFARPALALGFAAVAGSTVLVVNVVTGFFGIGGPLGWIAGTAAAWGLVALWAWLLVVWPLVVDPRRDGIGLRANARLAALMVLAFPLRIAVFLALTAVAVAVSTVLFVALVTISLAFAALVGCHFVLPAADGLEARL
jgi:hypothetical protein